MNWIGILLWAITHAGDLVALVRAVIGLIGSFPKDKAKQVKFDLSDAIKHKNKKKFKDVLEDAVKGSDSALPHVDDIKKD